MQHQPESMTQTQVDGDSTRRREYAWTDPGATVAALGGRAGIDVLRAMIAGELPPPPVAMMMGFEAVEFDVGRAVFALTPGETHYNPLGTVHGGVIATLLDSAAGCAVHSTLPHGSGYTTVDLHTTFLRPVTAASGRVTAEGSVLSRGSRTALAEARLTDERGRLLAHATSTCLVLDLSRPTGGAGPARS
jgi:uncharacterized protein (TIGR00369 family)